MHKSFVTKVEFFTFGCTVNYIKFDLTHGLLNPLDHHRNLRKISQNRRKRNIVLLRCYDVLRIIYFSIF